MQSPGDVPPMTSGPEFIPCKDCDEYVRVGDKCAKCGAQNWPTTHLCGVNRTGRMFLDFVYEGFFHVASGQSVYFREFDIIWKLLVTFKWRPYSFIPLDFLKIFCRDKFRGWKTDNNRTLVFIRRGTSRSQGFFIPSSLRVISSCMVPYVNWSRP